VSRVEATLSAVILVLATLLVTEWLHYQLSDTTLFHLMRPLPTTPLADGEEGIIARFAVTQGEFERYVTVLERMQADRALSIEEAAGTEQLTLAEFRDIEQRVQRNSGLVERARDQLRKNAENLWDSSRAALAQG
jgi:hypothetical protein